MTLTCKDCARLLSEKRDRRLPWRTRVWLRIHMFKCKMCQIYGAQLATVSDVCNEAGQRAEEHCPGHLSDDHKQRMKDALKRRD